MLTRQATDQHVELRLAVPPTGLREDSSQQDLCLETAASHRLSGPRLAQSPNQSLPPRADRRVWGFTVVSPKVKLRLREIKSSLSDKCQQIQTGVGALTLNNGLSTHNLELPQGHPILRPLTV